MPRKCGLALVDERFARNVFRGFADLADWIARYLRVETAVLDGEIACVDDTGRPIFRDLLFRRRQCVFIAFDLLFLDGKDLRTLPLIERKDLEEAPATEALTYPLSRSC